MTQETLQAQPKSSPVFKGWHVVAALSLILMLNAGLCFYNLPVLLNAFVVERSFSVGISSSATSLFFVMSGISGLLAGQLVDRFDVRYVIIISASVNSVVLASVGFINERYQLYFFLE